ncbi:hypothetical protein KsCSTR_26600 [Candidatus Kuenenia stuttgartiensis]|uniref:Uncharacterized protein n=1 Tax=Kuenenia stuttgartiensis TaxID=174633 RepID=Q1Q7A1_KUEST|nr:hypothetical protein KsCSTR_26600 [Candidatus Kuenenia stuttgartiensis]CAJ73462.1 unknown protein [Candidatus Kuenenia stuttgartiensis]
MLELFFVVLFSRQEIQKIIEEKKTTLQKSGRSIFESRNCKYIQFRYLAIYSRYLAIYRWEGVFFDLLRVPLVSRCKNEGDSECTAHPRLAFTLA